MKFEERFRIETTKTPGVPCPPPLPPRRVRHPPPPRLPIQPGSVGPPWMGYEQGWMDRKGGQACTGRDGGWMGPPPFPFTFFENGGSGGCLGNPFCPPLHCARLAVQACGMEECSPAPCCPTLPRRGRTPRARASTYSLTVVRTVRCPSLPPPPPLYTG